MPANVRNFWMDANIDGRDTKLSGGPRNKVGGFDIRLRQRDMGRVTEAVTIFGRANPDGTLNLRIFDADGELIFKHQTVR